MNKKLYIPLMLLLVLSVGIFFLIHNKKSEVKGLNNKMPAIVVSQVAHKDETLDYIVELNVPLVESLDGNRKIADTINTDLKKEIDYERSKFYALLKLGSNTKNHFNLSHEVVKLDDKILSMAIYSEQYITGDPHPTHTIFTYNYDLKKNHIIEISHLFPTPESLEKIALQSRIELKKYFRGIAYYSEGIETIEASLDAGTAPDYQNFDHFFIRDEGIEILFDENQVASYADGRPRILLPYILIGGFINPQYKYIEEYLERD